MDSLLHSFILQRAIVAIHMRTRPQTSSKGRFARSNFCSQLLDNFKEVSDVNQHLYELKQCKKNNWNQKMDRVDRPQRVQLDGYFNWYVVH